jgi:hypothetical protein
MLRTIGIIFFCLPISLLLGQGGMWLPSLLEKHNEKEMKALGCKLEADDVYQANQPSIKDAICQFNGGCTGEMISASGLLLTNHHCGFDAIATLSSPQNNHVDNGFWAKTHQDELPAKGVTALFVRRMEDVTALALQDVTEGMSEKDRMALIEKNVSLIRANTPKQKWEDILVRPFYNGNQFFLFVTVTYTDVRLVGTPPQSIGKFGSDTDNWVWPRHTGDFSLFRIYAGKDNLPAAYNPENVPYRPAHFLPISLDGIREGDFTMVYGFPGRTEEYLPAAAVRQTAAILDPAKVEIRKLALNVLDAYMREDLNTKLDYVSRYASIANAWKKWQGEMIGLTNTGAVDKKQALETEFTRRISENPRWNFQYRNLLPRLNKLIAEVEPFALGRDVYQEVFLRNNELFGLLAGMSPWIESYEKNGIGFSQKIPEIKSRLENFYTDYHPAVDRAVLTQLMQWYAQKGNPEWGGNLLKTKAAMHTDFAGLAAHLFEKSLFPNKSAMDALLGEPPAIIATTLKNDVAYQLWWELNKNYVEKIVPTLQDINPNIALLQRLYMAAQMEVFPEKRFFPDANSTLRLTYGKVRGYEPQDAVHYRHQSYLDGVMQKYIPGDYEFDVPPRLRELWETKDYGAYATVDGRMPVAFIGTNHTTGGNSGSPALDAHGNLVGLNFDRVWEGTMSDLFYDPAICRNIMVDARYILFIIDKFAGATHLLQEMKLVTNSRKKKRR